MRTNRQRQATGNGEQGTVERRKAHDVQVGVLKRMIAHTQSRQQAAELTDKRIVAAAQERLEQMDKVARSIAAAIDKSHDDEPRQRQLEAKYLEACQERAKLQRLLSLVEQQAA